MRKIAWVLPIVLLLALAPQVQAWGWEVHRRIVDVAYETLPENIRDLLVPYKIEEGWKAPDDPWGDFPHTFPDKYDDAVSALRKARDYYQKAQYSDASFWLGVAAHYIQDMVSLPHCVEGEPRDQHDYFESTVAGMLSPATPSRTDNFDLYSELRVYNDLAQQKWDNWLATENVAYVQEGLDLAASLTYNAWLQTLENVVPLEGEQAWPVDPRLLAAVALAVVVMCMAIGMRRYYRM